MILDTERSPFSTVGVLSTLYKAASKKEKKLKKLRYTAALGRDQGTDLGSENFV